MVVACIAAFIVGFCESDCVERDLRQNEVAIWQWADTAWDITAGSSEHCEFDCLGCGSHRNKIGIRRWLGAAEHFDQCFHKKKRRFAKKM